MRKLKLNKFFILTTMFVLMVGFVSAFNTQVPGTVYDASSNPVNGASVDVTCNSITKSTVTGSDGLYLVTFAKADCGFNTPVHVVASFDEQTGENNGLTCANVDICEGIPVALVDISIPEFSVIAGSVALVGALGIFIYRRKN
jgi:hypothetical protein